MRKVEKSQPNRIVRICYLPKIKGKITEYPFQFLAKMFVHTKNAKSKIHLYQLTAIYDALDQQYFGSVCGVENLLYRPDWLP